jgi:hypothetical protein
MKLSPRRIVTLIFAAVFAGMGAYWAMTGAQTASVVSGLLAFFSLLRAVLPTRNSKG